MNYIIAIDFDGTITSHEFPYVGQENPGAIQWMKRFQELGAKLILHTMRADSDNGLYLQDAQEYLSANDIKMWGYNINPTQHHWTQSRKIYAHLYIDDAAFGCPLHHPEHFERAAVDWSIVGPAVEKILLEMSV